MVGGNLQRALRAGEGGRGSILGNPVIRCVRDYIVSTSMEIVDGVGTGESMVRRDSGR